MNKDRIDTDRIKEFKTGFKNMWWDSSTDFPDFGAMYDASQQARREVEMESFIDGTVSEVKRFPSGTRGECPEWGGRLRANIHSAGVNALDFSQEDMDLLLGKGFIDSTYEFMDNARRFEASIKMDDIMQALRNVWIMNCIQLMLGREAGYNRPLFAYSMLYPYTDNYLDAPRISAEKKSRTGNQLRLRLEGKPVEASDAYEEKLFRLVGMIEDSYSREKYPEVFGSLLWIHDAQQNSLLQQKKVLSPYESDILDLSFHKGGTSVLADAFLVNGRLTAEEARFMFGFGTVLQLGDDLQDAVTDRRNGHMTLFSQTAGRWPMDSIANKLFNYTLDVLDSGAGRTEGELAVIVRKSCILLLLGAIANNSGLFSKDYLKRIEVCSPLGFKYARSMFARVAKEYRSLKLRNAGRPVDVYMARALVLGSGAG